MMKTIFLITFLLLAINSVGQNYQNYYKLCNSSDSLAYLGLYKQALDTLETAFEAVDVVHSRNYIDAYHLAIKLKQYDKAVKYGKKAIIISGNKNIIRTKSSKDFRKSIYYSSIIDSCDYFVQIFNDRVNHTFQDKIDSLYYIDQRIVRKNRSVRGNYNINKDELPINRFDLDSSNWSVFHRLVQEYGFPSEENVGYESYRKACILIIHNLRISGYEKYHDEYFNYITLGYYLPTNVVLWYEQYNMNVLGQTFFTTWDKNISEENIQRIDSNRRKFNLKGMNSIELSRDGLSMVSKW